MSEALQTCVISVRIEPRISDHWAFLGFSSRALRVECWLLLIAQRPRCICTTARVSFVARAVSTPDFYCHAEHERESISYVHREERQSVYTYIPYSSECLYFIALYSMRPDTSCTYAHAGSKHSNLSRMLLLL